MSKKVKVALEYTWYSILLHAVTITVAYLQHGTPKYWWAFIITVPIQAFLLHYVANAYRELKKALKELFS